MRPTVLVAGVLLTACASGPSPAAAPPSPRARPSTPGLQPGTVYSRAELDALGAGVVRTAREALGRPYRLGGTGSAGGGYDCSGLIQQAYAAHGIAVPRVSVEQALAGAAVPRDVAHLEPGDLLTFARASGDTVVSHVGLYAGDGRFIHSSSSRGVTESALAQGDPEGRWWLARWLGVRRILGP